jgi:hypothetical protein
MSTPREPDGRYERDPYTRDPYARDPGPADADADEPATWGRAPAGGWGAPGYGQAAGREGPGSRGSADDSGYDRPDDSRYDSDPQHGWDPQYGWQPPSTPERRHGAQPRYEPSWGQGHALTSRRATRSRQRLPLVAVAAAVLVVVAVLVLGFIAPGWFVTRVFDAAAVQTGVARVLTDDYGTEGVADVRCPAGIEVSAGATFTCDATIDGDPVTVPIRVTDDDGRYEVGRPT